MKHTRKESKNKKNGKCRKQKDEGKDNFKYKSAQVIEPLEGVIN